MLFVEYYSKGNFVEWVYVVEEKELVKYGIFVRVIFVLNIVEYKGVIVWIVEEVGRVFCYGWFGCLVIIVC